jgi:hypothetical protein
VLSNEHPSIASFVVSVKSKGKYRALIVFRPPNTEIYDVKISGTIRQTPLGSKLFEQISGYDSNTGNFLVLYSTK